MTMEQEKHNLESLFRKQLDASPPAFDPSYWTRAQEQIEQLEKERKRRRYAFVWLLSLGLLCLLAGGYWLFSPKETTQTEAITGKSLLNENVNENENQQASPAGSITDEAVQPESSNGRNLAADRVVVFDKTTYQPTANTGLQNKTLSIDQEKNTQSAFEKNQVDIDEIDYRFFMLKASGLAPESRSLEILPLRTKGSHFYAEAGLSVNPSFAAAGERTWHVAPYYELGINRLLGRKFAIETGLGYASISGINRSLQREDVSYSFIGSRSRQTLTHQQSQWLYLPLRLEYRAIPSVKLNLGMRLGYLVQTRAMLETLDEDDLGASSSSGESVRQYMDGLRRLNYQLEAGLSFSPGARWELRARAVQGLNSITQGDILTGGGRDRSLSLQLGVRYYLR
ncbi:MAG: porin family protein [Bacteroidia bacterium]